MATNRNTVLLLRFCIILAGIIICFFLFQKGLFYTAVFLFFIVFLLMLELFSAIKNMFLFYDKTIQAILNNDFSADFSKHASFENYKTLFKLYDSLKVKQNEHVSKDLVYRSILNNIETGVLILEKENEDWGIFLMNDYFSNHFQVPKVSKWHYLKNQLPSLCTIIEERDFQEIKTSLQISINKQASQTFILQASKTKTFDREYYIILLDSIQKVIEKKEKEAWINLMKVISHELMNSITPIRSLTQNLNELMQQEDLSKEDLEDIRQSVTTIIHRSDHLQNFVESYRKLAMLPTPNKETIDLEPLLENTLQVMAPLFKKGNISVKNTIESNRRIKADKLQIEQVLINLLTNSIYALEDRNEKEIEIICEEKNARTFITISDSGMGVDPAIEEKIFLPFFTTRIEGAGIGLTLSKNIIEAHGGYLSHSTENGRTSFTICLL
ncbi:sensor histidine kinase [Flavobacterium microcysteis]|uniref:histidine kinase n=1 Tax=Flavobacterium microcysteis TaxID=2596891 RepID=A0A501Q7K7_9FLAO|nr:ATP-binding protein [Flavobacterium microcysteis]TPD68388.1 GHKL domain-containing protein [Flavobacterium microcysteis]